MRWNPFVAAQRNPWPASLLAVFVVAHLPAMVGGRVFEESTPRAALVVLATTLAAHLVAHTPSWPDRLSALVLGNLATVFEYVRGRGFEFRDADEMRLLVGLSTFAWAWSFLAPRIVASRAGWIGAALLASFALGGWSIDSLPHLVGLAAMPVAVGLIAAGDAPLRRWALGAAAFGALVGLGRCFPVSRYGPSLEDFVEEPAGHAAAGLVIVLVGGLCRRARSMTVVPTDHPSIADFPPSRQV